MSVEIYPSDDLNELMIWIERDGRTVIESIASPVMFGELDYYPALAGIHILAVQDLDDDGEQEIVLDVTSHGASCCTQIVALYFDPEQQTYQRTNQIVRKWSLSPQFIDIEQDGKPEFVTRNANYNGLVGGGNSIAAISPIQIFRYKDQAIIDVTDQYPHLVEQDATMWLAAAQGEVANVTDDYLALMHEDPAYWAEDVKGMEQLVLRMYLADMVMLGKGEEGCQIVQEALGEDDLCPELLQEVETYLEESVAWDEQRWK